MNGVCSNAAAPGRTCATERRVPPPSSSSSSGRALYLPLSLFFCTRARARALLSLSRPRCSLDLEGDSGSVTQETARRGRLVGLAPSLARTHARTAPARSAKRAGRHTPTNPLHFVVDGWPEWCCLSAATVALATASLTASRRRAVTWGASSGPLSRFPRPLANAREIVGREASSFLVDASIFLFAARSSRKDREGRETNKKNVERAGERVPAFFEPRVISDFKISAARSGRNFEVEKRDETQTGRAFPLRNRDRGTGNAIGRPITHESFFGRRRLRRRARARLS